MSLTFLDSAMIKSPLKVPALSANTLDISTITFPLSDEAGNKGIINNDYSQFGNASIYGNLTVFGLLSALNHNTDVINYCFYVGQYGRDIYPDDGDYDMQVKMGRGRNEDLPFRTIKHAAAKIAELRNAEVPDNNPYTIFVKSGNFQEVNPIYLPSNTSVIGDNLRRTSITPLVPTYDIFWVDSACYIWGVTFRGHKAPSAAVAFPLWSTDQTVGGGNSTLNTDAFNAAYNTFGNVTVPPKKRPLIRVSPYVQGCTSYANSSTPTANDAGCGMRIDGSLVDGNLRSMVLDSFTQVNQGGKGIHIINHGYAQLVSIFTVCTTEGVVCESGGTCSISTSNCTFGLSGLVARGKSSAPILSGTFGNFIAGTNTFRINNVIPLQIPLAGSPYYPTDYQQIALVPYPNLTFTIDTLTQDILDFTAPTTAKNFFINSAVSAIDAQTYEIFLDNNIQTDLSGFLDKPVYFYARSLIETGGHTFEYMGCGTYILSALPSQGGVVNNDNEVVFDGLNDPNNPGIVYYTSSNEKGNYKIGPDFTIVQSTGTIEGDTFKKSILTLVTPLTIALE
jgi:hypothetical protein